MHHGHHKYLTRRSCKRAGNKPWLIISFMSAGVSNIKLILAATMSLREVPDTFEDPESVYPRK